MADKKNYDKYLKEAKEFELHELPAYYAHLKCTIDKYRDTISQIRKLVNKKEIKDES